MLWTTPNQTCAVSDGSYYPNEKVRAAVWIIITPDGTEWIEGGGVLLCPADVQNSYRSELGEQVGIASCLHCIKQEFNGQQTSLLTTCDNLRYLAITCDNLGALNKVGSQRSKTKPTLKSFDLITALLDTWNDIPLVARPQHVWGHQNDRIGPLLMNSERIPIWLDTHSAKQEKNAPSRCRSSFPNG